MQYMKMTDKVACYENDRLLKSQRVKMQDVKMQNSKMLDTKIESIKIVYLLCIYQVQVRNVVIWCSMFHWCCT